MKLRSSKLKQRYTLELPCYICNPQISSNSSVMLPLNNVVKRYYKPHLELYHFRKIDFYEEVVQKRSPSLAEIEKNSNEKDHLTKYYCFEEVVRNISNIVRNRVQRDHYSDVHFFGEIFGITRKHDKNMKKFKLNKKQLQVKMLEDDLLQMHWQKQILQNIDTSQSKEPNSTTIDLKILSSNIDRMTKNILCRKEFENTKITRKSITNLEKMKIIELKCQLEGISDIKKKQDRIIQRTKNHYKPQQQTYGLQKVKSSKLSKKIQLRTLGRQTLLSPLSLPQSPTSRFLLSQKNYGREVRNTKRSKQNCSTSNHKGDSLTLSSFPSSPNAHKSISMGLSKSGSRREKRKR